MSKADMDDESPAPFPVQGEPQMPVKSAVVVGAGLSGLATAWELQRRGVQVRVVESRERVGGVMQSIEQDGYLVDAGPSEMLIKTQEVEDTLRMLGLSDAIQDASADAPNRYIVRRGRPVRVPSSPLRGALSPLFSLRGKLRLGLEWRVKANEAEDESVADFVRRRVGSDFLEYGVEPLVSGIFAGDVDALSMRYAFPKLWDLERAHGGLLKGALAQRKGPPRYKRRLISFAGGMQALPRALAAQLGDAVYKDSQFLSAQRLNGQWRCVWRRGDDVHQFTADALVLAVPGHVIRALPIPGDLQRALQALSEVPYAPVSTVFTGYRRNQVTHPLDGFGVLVPRAERRRILGTLFLSSLFPGRAPEGCVGLMTFVGGMNHQDKASLPTATLQKIVGEELHQLLGVEGAPVFVHHHFWPCAIPQYTLGHRRVLDRIARAEERFPGLAVVGNFRGGPGAADCLASARATAERLAGC